MISFNLSLEGFRFTERKRKRNWIKQLVAQQGYRAGDINFVFMADDALLKINQEYLNHNTYTDIITFDNSDSESRMEGDIFISVERVEENAVKYGVPFEQELLRVMAHGILHLAGFKDKTAVDAAEMRKAEEEAISLYATVEP